MVKVSFITAADQRVTAEGRVGDHLLAVAQAAGMPLEGTCEGQMACSTCHVIVARDWLASYPPPPKTRKTCSTSPAECVRPVGWAARSN